MIKLISHGNVSYRVNVPDECPICHRFGDTQVIESRAIRNQHHVEVIFQCAFPECTSYFIGYYPLRTMIDHDKWKYLCPQKPELTQFKECVEKISPQFLKIYEQAEEAKALGLKDIAGPGYRKAFEFLIKDYAKKLAPDKADEIEKSYSGTVVDKYISDIRIQAAAKRALWLGNDETHYLRIWIDKDIEDMVNLIKLTIDWIDIEQVSKEYCKDMPEKKAPKKKTPIK